MAKSRKIINDAKFRQQILFNGLQCGDTSPSDIDFCWEIKNKFLIIGDVKEKGKLVEKGQRLMYERITDAWNSHVGKKALYLVVWHNVEKTRDIELKKQRVVNVYYKGKNYGYDTNFGLFMLSVGKKWGIDIFQNFENTMGDDNA